MVRGNILISGASAGLGMGMARRFAAMGRNLALCARRAERLDELRKELTSAHPAITVIVRELDVNDHDGVFAAFGELRDELGVLDRVIVNAGRSKGQPLGTGGFEANRQVVQTNLIAALAQAEAAMQIFRAQRSGHLVMISSIAGERGFARHLSSYAASKAGVTALAEGLRLETRGQPIQVSTILPGYIRSEMNAHLPDAPFIVDAEKGCRLLVRAIEREPDSASVPAWPWAPIGFALRHLPLNLVARLQKRIS